MKKLLIALGVGATVLGLTACNKADSGDATTSNKLYAQAYDMADPNMSTLWQPGLQDASVKAGFEKISLVDAKNDEAKAQEALDAALLKDYAAYLINVVDQTNGRTYVNKIKSSNKPLVFWNREVADAVKAYDKAYYVGIESAEGGRIQGKMAADFFNKEGNFAKYDRNKDGKLGVVVVRGESGHPDAEARTLFAPMYLERNLTGGNKDANAEVKGNQYKATGFEKVEVLEIVEGKTTGSSWDPVAATSEVERVLAAQGNKVDLVLSNNDGMALGIIKSSDFIASKMPIWGVDALSDALAEIGKEGTQFMGTVKNDGKAQAEVVVAVAKNLIDGKKPGEGLTVVETKEAWEADANAIWYDAPNKAFRVHHAMITAENVK